MAHLRNPAVNLEHTWDDDDVDFWFLSSCRHHCQKSCNSSKEWLKVNEQIFPQANTFCKVKISIVCFRSLLWCNDGAQGHILSWLCTKSNLAMMMHKFVSYHDDTRGRILSWWYTRSYLVMMIHKVKPCHDYAQGHIFSWCARSYLVMMRKIVSCHDDTQGCILS